LGGKEEKGYKVMDWTVNRKRSKGKHFYHNRLKIKKKKKPKAVSYLMLSNIRKSIAVQKFPMLRSFCFW